MAIVPRRTDTDVRLDALPNARFQPADVGANARALGRGLQGLGGELADAADTQIQIDAALDNAAVKQADTQLATYGSKRLYEDDDALFNTRGRDTLLSRPRVQEELGAQAATIRESLTTERQRKLFDAVVARRQADWGKEIGSYASKQAFAYETAESGARQYRATQDFVGAELRGDGEAASRAWATLRGEIRSTANREGMEGEPSQVEEAKALSGARASVVEGLLTADPQKAKEYRDAHADEIEPLTLSKLDKMLADPLEEQQADADANMIRGVATPGSVDGYTLPVKGTVVSGFGMRKHPIDGENKFHKGVDIAGAEGAPVSVRGAGTVRFAGPKGGYGNRIEVVHDDGSVSAYSHLSAINVKEGARVLGGTFIGAVGQTGRVTGPHLHYEEFNKAGEPLDPQAFMRRPAGPQNSARKNDVETQLAAVDQMAETAGWTFRRRQAAKARVLQLDSLDRRLKADDEEEANEQAWAIVQNPATTSVRSVPAAVWARMSVSDQNSVRAALKRNATGEDAPPNPALYLDLSEKAAAGTLASRDIQGAWGKLPKGDWEQAAGWLRTQQKGGADAEDNQVALSRIRSVSSTMLKAAPGLTTAGLRTRDTEGRAAVAQRQATFEKAMLREVAAFTRNTGKKPTDLDIQAMGDRLLIQSNYGSEEDPRYLFESSGVLPRVNVPRADYTRVRNRLAALMGRPVTDQEVFTAYRLEARGGQ